jgi:hypothetical protein
VVAADLPEDRMLELLDAYEHENARLLRYRLARDL